MLRSLVSEANSRKISTEFPEKLIAIPFNGSGFPSAYLRQLITRGYTLCMHSFRNIGMKTAEEVWDDISKYDPLEPTENEIRQINILKQAANILLEKFIKSRMIISKSDTEKPIFMFDRHKRPVNQDTVAEYADRHIWFDRNFMSHSTFEKALAVYLHELTHKHGGDETATFSYQLTEWMDICMKGLNDQTTADELADLKALWSELIPGDAELQEDIRFVSGVAKALMSSARSSDGAAKLSKLLWGS